MTPEQEQSIFQNKTETFIKLVGSQSTNTEIIALLAYIRNLINSGNSGEITVSVGKILANDVLNFDVNDQEIPDLIAQKTISIN
jgi:hypothetical protein